MFQQLSGSTPVGVSMSVSPVSTSRSQPAVSNIVLKSSVPVPAGSATAAGATASSSAWTSSVARRKDSETQVSSIEPSREAPSRTVPSKCGPWWPIGGDAGESSAVRVRSGELGKSPSKEPAGGAMYWYSSRVSVSSQLPRVMNGLRSMAVASR